jgi:hypothetical protein
METGLFEIQAQHLAEHRQSRQLLLDSRIIHAVFRPEATGAHIASHRTVRTLETAPDSAKKTDAHNVEFARCFLRLANLPNFVLDRLSRYEATLWRQAARILFVLDALDGRKPQERRRYFYSPQDRTGFRCE